jgi:hypothetical protein
LHATTFATPRLFVNVTFDRPGPKGDIYAGAKSRGQTVPNHIRAIVRVGPSRTKANYDEVATKINKRWDEVINDAGLGAQPLGGNLTANQERRIKRLQALVFTPMVAALEGGVIIPGVCQIDLLISSAQGFWEANVHIYNPQPGQEATWLKDNMAYFKEEAEVHDNADVRDMLKEVSERPDLKSLLA